MLPLISVDDAVRLGEELGLRPGFATSNIYRALLNSPTATRAVYGVVDALIYRNMVASRARELVILRTGWRTRSEYVFCQHVRISRELEIPDAVILGVREPKSCRDYDATDRALIDLADEIHENAEASDSTMAVLEKSFASEELVELIVAAGFWRMVAGFAKTSKISLEESVLGWPD